jgi:hypothetical protein
MKYERGPAKPACLLRLVAAALITVGVFGPPPAPAQVSMPARFYWKSLAGASAVPVIYESVSGNTNPFDPSHTVAPGANFDATLAMAGYAFTFPLADRPTMAAIILPMGHISGQGTAAGRTSQQSSHGFGDPMLEFDFNVLGPKAQINLPDALRYEPGFSLDILADLALPIGEYNNIQPLNLGQNRWYGRIGLPTIWQLGAWVPGRRTTLEFFPSVWLYGDNTDFVGQTLKTDPSIQVDAHLTRDFTEHLWGSLDATWYNGGQSHINGVAASEAANKFGVGLTFGYQINENVSLTFGYKSTVNDNAPTSLRMDVFMISLVSGWHPLIEGMNRLKSGT